MRVAHIVAHPPFCEGTGTACYYTALALQKLGCEVQVFAPQRTGFRAADLPGYTLMPRWLTIENAFLTPAILGLGRVDLVHLHLPFIMGAELTLLRTFARLPLVVTYHNDLIGRGVRRPIFRLYNALNAKIVLHAARKILVVSQDHAAHSLFGATLFRQRQADLVEILNGVDIEQFRPTDDRQALRHHLGLPTDDLLALFVGSLDRAHVTKGVDTLIDALAKVDNPHLRLLVAGEGSERAAYQQRATALGLGERVQFLGRVVHSSLAAYYAAADFTVLPSRPPESFGLVLVESMACATPVIGGAIPGVRTVVREGETGFLVPPGDAAALATCMARLANDQVLRQRLGQQGRTHVEQHYTWQRAGERTMEVYRGIV
jgi:glycosyltransferase involved in cell wall biosynthesis